MGLEEGSRHGKGVEIREGAVGGGLLRWEGKGGTDLRERGVYREETYIL